MLSEVVPLHRCGRCGRPGHPVDVEQEGEWLFSIKACDDCLSKTESELEMVRPIFDAMIAAGVSRKLANEAMTYLLDRMDQ